jgi:hypothetical protein
MNKENMATIDGNEAAARVAYRLNEVIAIFPITPASPMGEFADSWAAAGQPNLWGTVPSVVEMQVTTVQAVNAGEALGWSWLFPPYRWHFSGRAIQPTENELILPGSDVHPEAQTGTEHRKDRHPGISPGGRTERGKAVAEQ